MKSLIGLFIGLTLSLGLAALAGENPLQILNVFWTSGTASPEDWALSLFYSTSLMFTGLAVAVSFRAGLFNIGAEGQLLMGALVPTLVALSIFTAVPITAPVAFVLSLFLAVGAGALWGGIAGVLKAWRGSHEVVVTIMLNFVAAGILSYCVVGPFQSQSSQNPETEILPESFLFNTWDPIHQLVPQSPLNLSLVIGILLCLFFQWFFAKTVWGFRWRAMGLNPRVASEQNMPVQKMIVIVMMVSGGIAALVAMNDILGSAGKLRLGFSPEYGFMGIAVALLARNQPLAVIPSALLFGILHKGAADLDLETELINRDFAKVIQAVIVLSVIACDRLPLDFLSAVKHRLRLKSKSKSGGQISTP